MRKHVGKRAVHNQVLRTNCCQAHLIGILPGKFLHVKGIHFQAHGSKEKCKILNLGSKERFQALKSVRRHLEIQTKSELQHLHRLGFLTSRIASLADCQNHMHKVALEPTHVEQILWHTDTRPREC